MSGRNGERRSYTTLWDTILKKREGVSVRETDDGKVEIAVTGRVDGCLEKVIVETLPETERTGFSAAITKYRVEVKDQLSPAEQGEAFEVPRLVSEIQGEFEFADTDVFMEFHDWSLLDHASKMGEGEFAIGGRSAARRRVQGRPHRRWP